MNVSINNHNFKVKTLFLSNHTQEGMMGKKFTNEFNGILFLMPEGDHCFWMKGCIINLDIIFINDGKITKIHHDCPPCNGDECPNYCGEGDTILEVKGGTCKKLDIRENDEVSV